MPTDFNLADALKALSSSYRESSIYPGISQAILSAPIQYNYDTSPWEKFGTTIAKGLLGGAVGGYGAQQAQEYDAATKSALMEALAGKAIAANDSLEDSDIKSIQGIADLKIWEKAQEQAAMQQEINKATKIEMVKAAASAAAEDPRNAAQIFSVFGLTPSSTVAKAGEDKSGTVKIAEQDPKLSGLQDQYGTKTGTELFLSSKKAEEERKAKFLEELDKASGDAGAAIQTAKQIQEAASTPHLYYRQPGEALQEGADWLGQLFAGDTLGSKSRNQARDYLENTFNVEGLTKLSGAMKGALSDKETALLLSSAKSGIVDAESAKKVGVAMEQAAKRKADFPEFAQEYIKTTGSVDGLQNTWNKYLEEVPIFNPLSKETEIQPYVSWKDWAKNKVAQGQPQRITRGGMTFELNPATGKYRKVM